MNAPFNPRGTVRDMFSAFLSDQATVNVVRGVVGDHGWPQEQVHEGGLRAAVQTLAVKASPQVLLVDLSESADPLQDIDGLAEVCEPGTMVIACGTVNDVRFYRDLMASGIQDYLLKPFTAEHLADTISQAQVALMAPRMAEPSEEVVHVLAEVIGVRGGVGASSVATSLAWSLGERHARNTTLLDLDVHFGTGALALDLEPGRGLTDAIENPDRIDGLFIERALVRASDKLGVLSAEAPLTRPLGYDGAAFTQLQEELRNASQCTVVDLPRHTLVQHPELVRDASAIVLVTELTLAATRDTIRMLSWLKGHAHEARVLLVANKVPSGAGELSRADFEKSVETNVDIVLPLDAKQAQQAAKLGKPLAEVAKATKVGPAFDALADLVVGKTDAVGKSGRSLVGRLGDLRALVNRKPR